ncbi:MAG: triose-phosphate isomerase [Patescibacteria group bacterium]|jgi:triosephosphate isomerase
MKYIVANWKMNLGIRESVALARGTLLALQGKEIVPEVILCPSATALAEVHKTLARTRMHLGAQNVGPGRSGAFTGEEGVAQLEDVGCKYVILGHSESRALGEGPETIAKKMAAVWESASLTPILCVSEMGELKSSLSLVKPSRSKKLFLAYEPTWAIGTGNPATPADAVRELTALKTELTAIGFSADALVMLYGGSTNAENAYSYLREPVIDGLLVGGASLKVQEITGIINAAHEVITASPEIWS